MLTSFLSWFSIIPKGGRYEEIQDTIRRQTQDHQGLHGQGLISIRDRKNVGNFKTTRQILDFEDKGGEEMIELKINSEFQGLIPPMSVDEYELLEDKLNGDELAGGEFNINGLNI